MSVALRINFCDKRAQSQVNLSYNEWSEKDGILYLSGLIFIGIHNLAYT